MKTDDSSLETAPSRCLDFTSCISVPSFLLCTFQSSHLQSLQVSPYLVFLSRLKLFCLDPVWNTCAKDSKGKAQQYKILREYLLIDVDCKNHSRDPSELGL